MKLIGTGENLFPAGKISGVLRRLDTPEEVLQLLDEESPNIIAFTRFAGATFLSPLMDQIAGIISTTGTRMEHLAIVARELELPCILGARIEECPDGSMVMMDCSEGDTASIYLIAASGSGPAGE